MAFLIFYTHAYFKKLNTRCLVPPRRQIELSSPFLRKRCYLLCFEKDTDK